MRLALGFVMALAAGPAAAYTAYVTNERGNTVTTIDTETLEVTGTYPVGQRPRGIAIAPDGSELYVCASDDDTVEVYDPASMQPVHTLPSGPDPEVIVLHPSGNPLYAANEDDNLVTVVDVETRQVLAEIPVGVEPEGMGISPDGKIVVNTSETTNMAHFIDTETHEIVQNTLVDQRPRFAEFTSDGSLLYVSAEIGGTVSVIDPSNGEILHKIGFEVPGIPPEVLQPVGIKVSVGRPHRLRRPRAGEPRRRGGRRNLRGAGLPARRPARLEPGAHAGREISLHHQRQLQRRLGDRRRRAQGYQVDPCGRATLGRGGLARMKPTGDADARGGPQAAPAGQVDPLTRPERTGLAKPSDPPQGAPALDVDGLSHRFGPRHALKGVSLEVAQGSFTALIGVNGAGKTTLFNLVTGLFSRQSGQIEVCGHDVRTAPRAALARLGVVFQSRALDPALSISQNLAYQGALHGLDRRAALERAVALLARMGLAERMGERVRVLSGGQARRVEIAAALLHRPKLLLCDEATVGLDVKSRRDIVADLHALAADEGVGVLWATHLIEEIRPEDPVYVLHQGEILATGPAAAIAGDGTLSDAFLALTGGADGPAPAR